MYRCYQKNCKLNPNGCHNQINYQSNNTVYQTIRTIIKEYRHRKQLHRNIIILCFSLILVLMASVIIYSFLTQANTVEPQTSSKYFKSIQIEKGDTLWSIAQENMDANYYKNVSEYVKEIKTMNTLVSDHVKAGNYIIIPYYSEELSANH